MKFLLIRDKKLSYYLLHYSLLHPFSFKNVFNYLISLSLSEVDYPPKANAGSNMVLSLPINHLTLYGNASTDDKGIASYEWLKDSDELTADMTVYQCFMLIPIV